jgi:hypothetical protein
MSITHHTRKRPSIGPRTTHGPQVGMTGAGPLRPDLRGSVLRAWRAAASLCTSASGYGCLTPSRTRLVVGASPRLTLTTGAKSFLLRLRDPPRPRFGTPRQDPASRRSLPAQLDKRCLNSLSYNHRQATYTRPTRCMHYFKLHHIARECNRPRRPPFTSAVAGAAHLPRHEEHRRCKVFSTALPCTSDTVGSSSREEVPPQWSAAVEPTPSPPPSRFATPLQLLDSAVICYLLQRDTPMEEACDLMLLEQEFCLSVPPLRIDTTHSPPSVATLVQASAPTTQDEPSNGDDVVPASPASSEECLDCFLDAIQKKPTPLLLVAPSRPAVQLAPSEALRRSSSRLKGP